MKGEDMKKRLDSPQAISDFKSEYITAAAAAAAAATMIQLTPAHQGAQTALVALFFFTFYRRLVLSVISLISRLLSDLCEKNGCK